MATLSLDGRELVVSLSPLERIGALHRDLRVPLDAVTAADEVTDPLPAVRGIRAPGTAVPGRLKLGTWRAHGHRTFAAVRRGRLLSLPGAATLAERVTSAAGRPRTVEVRFPVADTQLAGTLLLPDGPGPYPAVLLLPGSGPVDRDSDHRRMALGVTRLLAEELAGAGIASLRYDKRGVGASGGDFRSTGLHDLVAGAVLLSGPARTGAETLQYQARALAEALPAPVRLLLRLLRIDVVTLNAKRIRQLRATTGDVARVGGVKINARWFRETLDHDPADTMARITVPVLAITGSADRQVDPADLDTVRATVAGPVETHRIDGVDHILRNRASGDPRSYRRESRQSLAPEVTELIVGWIHRQIRRE